MFWMITNVDRIQKGKKGLDAVRNYVFPDWTLKFKYGVR